MNRTEKASDIRGLDRTFASWFARWLPHRKASKPLEVPVVPVYTDEEAERLSSEQQKKVYQSKETTSHDDSLIRLYRLFKPQESLQKEVSELESPEKLKELSLLRHSPSSSTIDEKTLSLLVGQGFREERAEDLEKLWNYLKHSPLNQILPLDSLEEEVQSMLTQRKTQQTWIEKGTDPQEKQTAETGLHEMATKIAEDVKALKTGERCMLWGGVPSQPSTLIQKLFKQMGLDQFFESDACSKWVKQLCDAIEKVVGRENQATLDQTVKEVFEKGLSVYLFPSLFESLFKNRSLGEKILLAPLGLLQGALAKGASYFCDARSKEISLQFLKCFKSEDREEIQKAIREGTLSQFIEKKLKTTLTYSIETIRKGLLQAFSEMTSIVPTALSCVMEFMDMGHLGENKQSIWFEVERQEDGRLTLCVFAGGKAALSLSEVSRGKEKARTLLVQYRDLEETALDGEFFRALLLFEAKPQWDSSFLHTLSNLYEGLLGSLQKPRQDLSKQVAASSIKGSQCSGIWSTLYAFIHYRLNVTDEQEERFFFSLQKQLFLDTARIALQDREISQTMKKTLQNQGELWLQTACKLHEEKKLSFDELKQIYATVWEVFQSFSPLKTKKKGKPVVVPPALAQPLRTLFSSVPSDLTDTVKDLVVGAAGPDLEEMIDAVLSELSPPSPTPEPAMPTWPQTAHLASRILLQLLTGLSYEDFQKPTFGSYLRGALFTGQLAVAFFFPATLSLQGSLLRNVSLAVTLACKSALANAIYAFLPHSVQTLSRLKNQWMGNALVRWVLTEEQQNHFSCLVREYKSLTCRSQEVSCEMALVERNPKIEKLSQKLIPIPTRIQAPSSPDIAVLQPYPVSIRPEEITLVVQTWVDVVDQRKQDPWDIQQQDGWYFGNSVFSEINWFLTGMVKQLPVPSKEKSLDFWTKVPLEDIEDLLEAIGTLTFYLHRSAYLGKNLSEQRKTEIKIQLFKLYAITDVLARRCPQSKLEGFSANGWSLANWNYRESFRLNDSKMREELKALQIYFEVDPEQDAHLESHSLTIMKAERNCLFFPVQSLVGELQFKELRSIALQNYLAQFLKDESTTEKMKVHGLQPTTYLIDQYSFLYTDPGFSIPSSDATEERTRLETLFGSDPRRGVLPRPFYWLRRADFFARDFFSHGETGLPYIVSVNQDFSKILDQDNHIRRAVVALSFGRVTWEKGPSSLDAIPGAYFVKREEGPEKAIAESWKPLRQGYDHGFWDHETSVLSCYVDWNLQKVVSRFLHLPPRDQNEIIQNISQWDGRRRSSSSGGTEGTITSFLRGFFDFQEEILPNSLTQLSRPKRKMLEMLRSDPKETAPRILSFFEADPDSLAKSHYMILFSVLFLQGEVFYPYLVENPEFSKTVGAFFQRMIQFFLQKRASYPNRWETLLRLIEIGMLARTEATTATKKDCEADFPDFRAHLLEVGQKGSTFKTKAMSLLSFPWHFIEPCTEKAEAAISDLLQASLHHRDALGIPKEIGNAHVETFWKWEPVLRQTFNDRPQLKNRLLTQILVSQGLWTEEGGPLQWEGQFPHYSTDGFSLTIAPILQLRSDVSLIKEAIKKGLQEIFQAPIPQIGEIKDSVFPISSHSMWVRLREDHQLTYFKLHEGKKYEWVQMQSDEPFTYWKGTDESCNMLCLDRKGEIRKIYHLVPGQHPGTFALLPDCLFIKGELCEGFDFANTPSALVALAPLLGWFQSPSSIRAHRSVLDSSQIRRIEFTDLKISFFSENGLFLGEKSPFCGLHIAKQQNLSDRYPVLKEHTRYLLLENSGGHPKVLLLKDSFTSVVAQWLIQQLGLETSQLMDRVLHPLFETMQKSSAKEDEKWYLYDLDSEGHLTSSDSEAMLQLLLYHLAQGTAFMDDVKRNLEEIEDLGRREPFSFHFFKQLQKLQFTALAMNHLGATAVVLRLSSIAHENKLKYSIHLREHDSLRWVDFLSALVLQRHYWSYLQQRQKYKQFRLSEIQEYMLLDCIAESIKKSLAWEQVPLQFLIQKIGMDGIIEVLVMHPQLVDRYSFLKRKYSSQKEGIGWRDVLRSMCMRQITQVGTSLIETSGTQGLGNESFLSCFLSTGLMCQKISKDLFLKDIAEKALLAASWETVPLASSEMTLENWYKYMHVYYLLARGVPPSNVEQDARKKELFVKKRKELIRTLYLLQGTSSYDPKIDIWLGLLRLLISHPMLAKNFPELHIEEFFKTSSDASPKFDYSLGKGWEESVGQGCLRVSIQADKCWDCLFSWAKEKTIEMANVVGSSRALSLIPHFTGVLSWAPWVHGAYEYGAAGFQAYRRERNGMERAYHERFLLEQAKAAPVESLVSKEVFHSLCERDQELGNICFSILKSHTEEHPPADKGQPVQPFDATSNDQLIRNCFNRLNRSLIDFDRREEFSLSSSLFQPKGWKEFYSLGRHLKQAQETMQEGLDAKKKEILSMARKRNREGLSDSELVSSLVHDLDVQDFLEREDTYFQDLIRAFAAEDEPWLAERTQIRGPQKQVFQEQMLHFLLDYTRLHQLERAIRIWNEAEQEQNLHTPQSHVLLHQLSTEMTRKRAYSLESCPFRLMKTYLLLEYGLKIMCWKGQAKQLEGSLLNLDSRAVSELATGGGKTSVHFPAMPFHGKPGKVMQNIYPDPQAGVCIDQISRTSKKAFGQRANAISISRKTPLTAKTLDTIRLTYVRDKVEGEYHQGRKRDLQILELRFLEEAFLYQGGLKEGDVAKMRAETLLAYMNLLQYIRREVHLNVDEAHWLFRRNEELNHPIGWKKNLPDSVVKTVLESSCHLVEEPQIALQIALQSSQPKSMEEPLYKKKIKPCLAKKMSQWKRWNLSLEKQTQVLIYLEDPLAFKVPGWLKGHPKEGEIRSAHQVLNHIMPHVIGPSSQWRVTYGQSKQGRRKQAIPYVGNNKPLENSNILDPLEALLKTGMLYLQKKLEDHEIKEFHAYLQAAAEEEANKKNTLFNHTSIGRAFASWVGEKESLEDFLKHFEEDRWKKTLNRSPRAILAYVRLCVAGEITYYSHNLKSNSYDFASMGASYSSATATPNQEEAFPFSPTILWDEGTMGEFVSFICNTNTPEGLFVSIESSDPREILEETLRKNFQLGSGASALIDGAALLIGWSAKDVAAEMLKYITTHRQDLRGVVFIDDQDRKMIWEKGCNDPTPLENSPLKPEERLTYYDQIHTTGTDIKQPAKGVGIVTLNSLMNLEEFMQICGRMRGLTKAGQRLQFLYSEQEKQKIFSSESVATSMIQRMLGSPLTDPASSMTRKMIICFAKNLSKGQGEENYLAARAMISSLTRRAIIDEMIFSKTVKEMMRIFVHFRSVLIEELEINPCTMFGFSQIELSPQEALEKFKQEKLQMLEKSQFFSEDKLEKIKKQLEPIGKRNIFSTKKVLIAQNEKPGSPSRLGVFQTAEQNQEQNQNTQLFQQQNQQLNQNLSTEETVPETEMRIQRKTVPWNSSLSYFTDLDASWLKPSSFAAASNHSAAVFYLVADSPSLVHVSRAFQGRMFWSNNFLSFSDQTCAGVCIPLMEGPKPVSELLVVRTQNNDGIWITSSIAIDYKEVEIWKGFLKKNREGHTNSDPRVKIGLFDLGLQEIRYTGKTKLTTQELFQDPGFKKDIIRWKFLAGTPRFSVGDVSRDQEMRVLAQEWMKPQDPGAMKNLFSEIYKNFGRGEYDGSDIEQLFVKEEEEDE